MWRKYFKFKAVPGVIITQTYGRIDFRSENLSVPMLMDLWENDFPYLEITEEGRNYFYGVEPAQVNVIQEEESKVEEVPKKRVGRKRKALE